MANLTPGASRSRRMLCRRAVGRQSPRARYRPPGATSFARSVPIAKVGASRVGGGDLELRCGVRRRLQHQRRDCEKPALHFIPLRACEAQSPSATMASGQSPGAATGGAATAGAGAATAAAAAGVGAGSSRSVWVTGGTRGPVDGDGGTTGATAGLARVCPTQAVGRIGPGQLRGPGPERQPAPERRPGPVHFPAARSPESALRVRPAPLEAARHSRNRTQGRPLRVLRRLRSACAHAGRATDAGPRQATDPSSVPIAPTDARPWGQKPAAQRRFGRLRGSFASPAAFGAAEGLAAPTSGDRTAFNCETGVSNPMTPPSPNSMPLPGLSGSPNLRWKRPATPVPEGRPRGYRRIVNNLTMF